jgi:hypothetical protein
VVPDLGELGEACGGAIYNGYCWISGSVTARRASGTTRAHAANRRALGLVSGRSGRTVAHEDMEIDHGLVELLARPHIGTAQVKQHARGD